MRPFIYKLNSNCNSPLSRFLTPPPFTRLSSRSGAADVAVVEVQARFGGPQGAYYAR